ncbi:MAG: UDP-2,3-diacylglucosamine diphosphatase [Gammaproteobacteria bacterium]|nr:UDP-2,3-diacylglucosamine diphosphatase [Gammaproteobacteria bacterium]
MSGTLFISDLHLDPARPAITTLFHAFLARQAGNADALYILGDLFEAWVGDDDDSADNLAVCESLKQCALAGTPVFIMHGNRDFLLGDRFAQNSGATLLDDPTVIDLYGRKTLLMHGDTLCTDDTGYMAFRARVRDPGWQAELLARPLAERQAIALEMRQASREQTGGKPESIMDVNQDAVIDVMRRHGVTQLIHGHTHRPFVHNFDRAGKPARRIVLGDWYEQGSVLACTADECELMQLPVNQG